MRKSGWKAVVSWMLVIAMLGSYGSTVQAAELQTTDIVQEEETIEETAETGNPFLELLDASESSAGIMPFRLGYFENDFEDQLEDPLTQELYSLMEDTFAVQKKEATEKTTLQNPVEAAAATVAEAKAEAKEELVNSFYVAFAAFYYDHPESFWINRMSISMSGTSKGSESAGYTVRYTMVTLTSMECYDEVLDENGDTLYPGAYDLVEEYDAAVQAAKAEIEAGAEGNSRYALTKAAHDWLCEKLNYNNEAAANMGNADYLYAHTSATAFLGYHGDSEHKSVVCEGYAKAFKVLCDQWGIPCVLVSGMGGNPGSQGAHMWNSVQMEDGSWYGVDATWDDQGSTIYDTYYLAGSSTKGFQGYTFSEQHAADASLAKDGYGNNLYAFVYPDLSEKKCPSTHQGRVQATVQEGKRILKIQDLPGKAALTDDEITEILQEYTLGEAYAQIVITRRKADGQALSCRIPASWMTAASQMLAEGGTLDLRFWDTEAGEVTWWTLTGVSSGTVDADGSVSMEQTADGTLLLEASAAAFPAEQVQLRYTKELLSGIWEKGQELCFLEQDSALLITEGSYETVQDDTLGERTYLTAESAKGLAEGTAYTVGKREDYVWSLEREDGLRLFQEEAALLGRLSETENTTVSIGKEGNAASSVISKELLTLCAQQGLDLEFILTETASGTTYIWSFQGLSGDFVDTLQDFSLEVGIQTEDSELPAVIRDGIFVEIALPEGLPSCESASLCIRRENLMEAFAGSSSVCRWEKTSEQIDYIRRLSVGEDAASELRIELKPGVESCIWSIYLGTTESGEDGLCLRISDTDLTEALSEEEITEILEKRAGDDRYQNISITRTGKGTEGLSKKLPAAWMTAASQLLTESGTLDIRFWDTEAGEVTWWSLTDPEKNGADKDGTVYAEKGEDDCWSIALSDSGFSAGLAKVRYGLPELAGAFGNQQKLYYFKRPNQEICAEGVFEEIGDPVLGTVSYLTVNSTGKLQADTVYYADTGLYDWKLEQGRTQEQAGVIYHFQTLEKLEEALEEMSDTSVRISYLGEEQPTVIPGELLGLCARQGLTLEYLTRDAESGISCLWSFSGLSQEAGRPVEDFQMKALLREDLEKPELFGEGFALCLETAGAVPDCQSAALTMEKEGLTEGMSATGSLGAWNLQNGALYRMEDVIPEAGEDQIRIPLKDGAFICWIGEAEEQEFVRVWKDGQQNSVYYDLDTGERVQGWDIIHGVKCYFDKNGYLAEGPVCVNGVWYLFGNYEEGSYGLLTGYQEYHGTYYFANAEGVLQLGWQKIGSTWHYFSMEKETCGEELPSVQNGNWVLMQEEAGEGFAGRRYYFKSNKTLLKGWQTIGGKKYLFETDGYVRTGWYSDGTNTYYLDEQEEDRGALLKGIQTIGEHTYYFNSKGVLQYGWQKLDGQWRYFSRAGGSRPAGSEQSFSISPEYWVTVEDGGRFYLKNGTTFVKGWQTINDVKYFFDPEGRLKEFTPLGGNWYELDGERYYLTNGKTLATGWKAISKKKYYFDSQGRMQTGEFEVKGKRYRTWEDPSEENYGSICTGWQIFDGETYYFSSSGQCASGLVTVGKYKYCFDAHGKMLFGRQTIKGKDYYFMDAGEASQAALPVGSLKKGLIKTGDGTVYYTGKKEYLLSGWQKIDGVWHYFDKTAKAELEVRTEAPLLGWQKIDGVKYYFTERGEKAIGITKVGTKFYYFDRKGVMQTGLIRTREGDTYYFDTKGVQVTGWKKLDGTWYYFRTEDGKGSPAYPVQERGENWYQTEMNGELCTFYFKKGTSLTKGYVTIDKVKYYFDSNGVLQKGWFRNGSKCFYSDPETGAIGAAGFYEIEGRFFYLNSNGQLQTGWKTINKKKYYFDPADGHMVTGFFTVSNGKTYYFSEQEEMAGVMQTGPLTLSGEQGEEDLYLLNSSGILQTGWVKQSGQWNYYAQSDGTRHAYQEVNPELLAEVPNAYYQWYQVTENSGSGAPEIKWFCLYKNTKILKGLQTIGSFRYYFDSNGVLCKGSFTAGGKSCYSDPETGAIDPKGRFLSVTGEDGSRILYYYNGKGQRVTGWLTVDGKKYYFSNVTGAAYMGGKYYIGNVLYTFDSEGILQAVPEISLSSAAYRILDVSWKPAASAVKYMIEYAQDAGFSDAQTVQAEAGSTEVSILNLEPGIRYYVRMRFQLEGEVIYTGNSGAEEAIYSVYSPVKSIIVQGEEKASAASARIEACELVPGASEEEGISAVKIKAVVTGRLKSMDESYYLVRIDTYKNQILGEPLLEISKEEGVQERNEFTFEIRLPFFSEEEQREGTMNKYALAVKSANGYTRISAGSFVDNPELFACNTEAYFMPSSKKGIQGANSEWAEDSGTKNTLLNLNLKDVVLTEDTPGAVCYEYKGTTYYFSELAALKDTVSEFNRGDTGHRIQVSLVILMGYDKNLKDMIHPSARRSGAAPYYMLNTTTQSSQERLEAVFCYLGEVFGQEDCLVSNWILGNEVNSCNAWNYKGGLSFSEYIRGYANAFRTLYYGIKKTDANSRVFISLDNAWTRAVAGYTGKATLDRFAEYIEQENAAIQWNIAYHPYSAPLTRTEFWKDTSNTTNSLKTGYISMQNLSVLTQYAGTLEEKYGKPRDSIRIILSEQGWTSSYDREYKQAQAIARAYYIAEFNPRVDAFIIRAEIDDKKEGRTGLRLGLKNYDETKKIAYYVYKYMDTPLESSGNEDEIALKDYVAEELGLEGRLDMQNVPKFEDAQEILLHTQWEELIEGFDAEKLNQMPYGTVE